MRNPHAGQPFTTSDTEIAAALKDVSVPALLLSCVHMSDDSLLDGPIRPAGIFLNEVQGFMSEEDRATARKLAFDVIRDYRDRGCPEPAPVGSGQLKRMMDWLVCTDVPDEYVPLMLDEMELDGRDSRITVLSQARKRAPSFPSWWSASASPACWPRSGCSRRAFRTPSSRRMPVSAEPGGRTRIPAPASTWETTSTATVLNPLTTGPSTLRNSRSFPFIPAVTGAKTFTGPAFHTAMWDHSVDLCGKDVVLLGAGATGFQVAPAIADKVRSLTIFQRTAQWMFPNPNYHAKVGPGVKWALKHLPFYGRWYRFLLFWPACDSAFAAARVDPDWPDQQSAVSAGNDMARMMFTEWISSKIDGNTELLAKVIPDYPATGKRTLQDNGSWLRTLTKSHVRLVRDGIDHIEADAVVGGDGRRYPANALIYATGFRVNDMISSFRVVGRDGIDLQTTWGSQPAAYLGITVPNFPNFFCLYGPGTNLASGDS